MLGSCKDLDDQILPYLEKELSRVMELNKKPKAPAPRKKNVASNASRNQVGKCVARKCPSKNVVDMGNVGAFGICFKCGGIEHFKCASTNDDEKNDIIEGTQE